MRIWSRASTASVGDLLAPDPRAVHWLERDLHEFEAVPGNFIGFGIKRDVEWIDYAGTTIVIEPTLETLVAAAADFRDGFWIDVPYPPVEWSW